jgi:hypothetical protein
MDRRAAACRPVSDGREEASFFFTGSHRYLVEYLLEEVVGRQAQDTQDFLLATSVLERLHASLCDAVAAADPNAEWCVFVRVAPVRIQSRRCGGWGNLETIDLAP